MRRLGEILERLVLLIEAQSPGMLCSVLLLSEDGDHVRHGAAPSLPPEYVKAIDGSAIGQSTARVALRCIAASRWLLLIFLTIRFGKTTKILLLRMACARAGRHRYCQDAEKYSVRLRCIIVSRARPRVKRLS